MRTFYVRKESGTFTDAIECFGLVSIIEGVFKQSNSLRKPKILIEDKGFCYQITCDQDLSDDIIKKCSYFDFIPFIHNKKDKDINYDFSFIDYEHEKEVRDKYYKLSDEEKKNTENPIYPDYDVIRLFADMEGYRKSFYNQRAWKDHFSQLLEFIFGDYSVIDVSESQFNKPLKEYIKIHSLRISDINALQDINPDKGKGVNQTKANGISLINRSEYWLNQLIRFSGAWKCFISEYVITGKKNEPPKDYIIYSLSPVNISNEFANSVYREIKKSIHLNYSIKTDIIMILLTTKELIIRHPHFENKNDFFSPVDKISGLQTSYYKKLGKFSSAVTNISNLGLPNFVNISNVEDGEKWLELFNEHHSIINQIDGNNSSNIGALQNYRQFLSSSDFELFFNFIYQYSENLIADINLPQKDKRKQYLKCFKTNNMEVLLMCKKEYFPILANEGFRSVAKAIRNATIKAQYAKNRKEGIRFPIHYGMAQDLRRKSDFKEELIKYVSEFVATYNSETARIAENNPELVKLRKIRSTVKTVDIEELTKLVDDYGSGIVGRLLCAYGYSLEKYEETEETKEVENESN